MKLLGSIEISQSPYMRAFRAAVGLFLTILFTSLGAQTTVITFTPTVDNALFYSSIDPTPSDTVYKTGVLYAGCDWSFYWNPLLGFYVQDWICVWSALKFNVGSQIGGKTITQATLQLTPFIVADDNNTTFYVAAFSAPWDTNTITFNLRPNVHNAGQISVNAPSTTLPVVWDVTEIVRNWATGTWANNGFMIGDYNPVGWLINDRRITSFYSLESHYFDYQIPLLTIVLEGAETDTIFIDGFESG